MTAMEIDFIDLGCSPYGEDCAQVGEPNFRQQATKEMKALINQLHREFPEIEETNLVLKIKWYPHDFGSYGSVVATFFPEDEKARILAYAIEGCVPAFWDDEAKIELGME